VLTEIKIFEYGYTRRTSQSVVFNPTFNQTGGILYYDFDKYID